MLDRFVADGETIAYPMSLRKVLMRMTNGSLVTDNTSFIRCSIIIKHNRKIFRNRYY